MRILIGCFIALTLASCASVEQTCYDDAMKTVPVGGPDRRTYFKECMARHYRENAAWDAAAQSAGAAAQNLNGQLQEQSRINRTNMNGNNQTVRARCRNRQVGNETEIECDQD